MRSILEDSICLKSPSQFFFKSKELILTQLIHSYKPSKVQHPVMEFEAHDDFCMADCLDSGLLWCNDVLGKHLTLPLDSD